METELCFVMGDMLPTIYDAAIQIYSVSKYPPSKKRIVVVHAYAVALRDIWLKSFGEYHVLSLCAIKNRLISIMHDYNNTLLQRYRSDIKFSIRSLNKEWRMKPISNSSKKRGRRPGGRQVKTNASVTCNNDLLDIIRFPEKLTGDELAFYKDQCSDRICRLSEHIDTEYEADKENQESEEIAQNTFSDPVEYREVISETPSRSDRYLNRQNSPHVQPVELFKEPTKHTTISSATRPEIRKKRNCTDTIATISYKTAVSIPKARVAFQTVCQKFYGHRYYLNKDEQKQYEPNLQPIMECDTEEDSEPNNKRPRTAKDYEAYRYVLPSPNSVGDFKHLKALQQEIAAGKALSSLEEGTRVTMHYDTTGRSRVEGEWPAIILNFLNNDKNKCRMYRLRALFFAHENREQIVALILQTLERLSTAIGGAASPKQLWENTYAYMTDAVSKNLKVEQIVSDKLGTKHVPKHILCKSHTCEKLDESCIDVLVSIERQLKLSELLTKRQPRLKSFINQSKCVAESALKSLIKLVTHSSDGKSVSLAKEFDIELENDGTAKSVSLYKERRFTKLGYSAGSVLNCLPQFQKILNDTHLNNLLVSACKLYLENDYILAAFKALSFFTYKVTMPYLNCIEICNQNDLVGENGILKKLSDGLKSNKMDTLKDYHVEWKHVDMSKQQPESPLDHLILKYMCHKAASVISDTFSIEYVKGRLLKFQYPLIMHGIICIGFTIWMSSLLGRTQVISELSFLSRWSTFMLSFTTSIKKPTDQYRVPSSSSQITAMGCCGVKLCILAVALLASHTIPIGLSFAMMEVTPVAVFSLSLFTCIRVLYISSSPGNNTQSSSFSLLLSNRIARFSASCCAVKKFILYKKERAMESLGCSIFWNATSSLSHFLS